jgi:hypothetical protein
MHSIFDNTMSTTTATTATNMNSSLSRFKNSVPASRRAPPAKNAKNAKKAKGKTHAEILQDAKDSPYFLNVNSTRGRGRGRTGYRTYATHDEKQRQNYSAWLKSAGKPIYPCCTFEWFCRQPLQCCGCGSKCPERVAKETSRSFDCRDPSKCYQEKNVQTLCMFCNILFGSYQKPAALVQMQKIIDFRATQDGAF